MIQAFYHTKLCKSEYPWESVFQIQCIKEYEIGQLCQLCVIEQVQQQLVQELQMLALLVGTLNLVRHSQAVSSHLSNPWKVIWVGMTLTWVKQVRSALGLPFRRCCVAGDPGVVDSCDHATSGTVSQPCSSCMHHELTECV